MSTVYFADLIAKSDKDSILIKTAELFEKLYKDNSFFRPKDMVGIKTHFGEIGPATFLRHIFSRVIIEKLKEKNALPFLFDTSTLYTQGQRTNAIGHITAAIKNGFSYASVGAPIIIADGLTGANFIEIKIEGKHFKKVKIANDIQYMDAIVCLSHFKGHCATGFGGALKSISMGMAARAGKLEMHSQSKPFITNKCTACGTCITVCPAAAIEIAPSPSPLPASGERTCEARVRGDKKAYINPDICIGCMRCDIQCPMGAIKFNWDCPETILMEKMAEYASGVLNLKKNKLGTLHTNHNPNSSIGISKFLYYKIVYLNFLLDITPDCDCYGFSNAPVSPDIGVLASSDPVAIDQASVDMVNKCAGKDIFRKLWPNADYEHMLKYSESLGIGTRKYNITKI